MEFGGADGRRGFVVVWGDGFCEKSLKLVSLFVPEKNEVALPWENNEVVAVAEGLGAAAESKSARNADADDAMIAVNCTITKTNTDWISFVLYSTIRFNTTVIHDFTT
jgi:hypothetical protein